MLDKPVVAIVNTSEDTVEMLTRVFEMEGFATATEYVRHLRKGQLDLPRFVRDHKARVVVFDIAPPYEANWRTLQQELQKDELRDVPFVITTTNERQVRSLGATGPVFEILGKPYDLDRVLHAVRTSLATL